VQTGPPDASAGVERLCAALECMASALASGDLGRLLAAQEQLAAARLSSDTLRSWPEQARTNRRAALRRVRAGLNGCQRTNAILLKIVDACLTGADVDYTRAGDLPQLSAVWAGEGRVSCRV
jgi:hypothetical protein